MQNFFSKIKTYVATHRKTSIAIGIAIVIIAYMVYSKVTSTTGDTTYTLGTAQNGTIVSSISGTGQVSSGRTLDLKPEASGTVTYVGIAVGQTVHTGQLIASVDSTSAQKAVRDAEANLTSAQIAMEKFQEPADSLTLLEAQNALTSAKASLTQDYQSGFNQVSSTFLNLPSIITGLDGALHNTDVNPATSGQLNVSFYSDTTAIYETSATAGKGAALAIDAEAKYKAAKAAYDATFDDYKNTSRDADITTIQNLIQETYKTSQAIADAVKSANTLIQYYQDTITSVTGRTPTPKSTTYLNSISSYTSQITGDVSALFSAQSSITNDTTAVSEKQISLDKTTGGADPLDLQSQQLSLTRAQNALQDAKDALANYSVYAPFSGTISKVAVKPGDQSGTSVATLITSDQVVDISLNEVDVSKVSLGDKVTLTFDAIDSLTLTGKVAGIDPVGTVTQGVVNYTVTIAFDSTDERVKPGMSTTASIITEVHPDVLTVPSSAVKSSGGRSYVLAFPDGTIAADQTSIVSKTAPTQVPVTVGISDDTNTEIDSGLADGQQIVTKSVVVTTAKTPTATSATSLLGGNTGRTATRAASSLGAAR